MGLAGARQGLADIAGIIGQRAAIPAAPGRARIHAQRKAPAMILVGGDGAAGRCLALVADHAGEVRTPQGHLAIAVAVRTQQALTGRDRTGGLVGDQDRNLARGA